MTNFLNQENCRKQEIIEDLIGALVGLKGKRDCFCQASIGNPMVPDHTKACKTAMDMINRHKQGKP